MAGDGVVFGLGECLSLLSLRSVSYTVFLVVILRTVERLSKIVERYLLVDITHGRRGVALQ